MHAVSERCAAIAVGKDEIAVAVRMSGDGPDGRVTVKRTFRMFYGVMGEAARWLVSLGVTHVAMEVTGTYSMPVYYPLLEHGDFGKVLICNAAHVKNAPGRKTDPWRRRGVAGAPAGVRAAGGQLHPAGRDQGARDVIRYAPRSPSSGSARSPGSATLCRTHLKLSSVVSDIRRICGERNPTALAQLATIDYYTARIEELTAKIEVLCQPYLRQIEQLDAVPGTGVVIAQDVMAEIGYLGPYHDTPGIA